jgi:hypothetical protein
MRWTMGFNPTLRTFALALRDADFINAGAMYCRVVLAGHHPREAIGHIPHCVRFVANDISIAVERQSPLGDRMRLP